MMRLKNETENLILENLDRATLIAKTMHKKIRKEDFDDIISDAYLGLIIAALNYDGSKAKFTTYADIKVKGYILDGIRHRSHRYSTKKTDDLEFVPLDDYLQYS